MSRQHTVARPWFIALIAAFIVIQLASWLLDGPDDIQAAQDTADYTAALADSGAAHCAELGRVPVWTSAGDLVCRATGPVVAKAGAR